MALSRILLGFVLVAAVFVVWRELERRVHPATEGQATSLGSSVVALGVEAGLLTLFAGLWFGSLGSGGVLLLFLLVGALMEIPPRLRHRPPEPLAWKVVAQVLG
jgi:uncharacterized membrane protein YfcA